MLAVLACSAADASADAPKPAAPPPASSTDAAAANDFTFAMYGKIRQGGGNVFFSGPSLREALGIAYLGARGDTASEMSTALHLDPDASKSAASAKDEIAAWDAARGGAELSIANRLWADASFRVRPEYAASARDAYGAPTEPIDFVHQAEPSRAAINAWVTGRTHDRIKDLLPGGSIDSDTRVVITNAIYFKGDWASPFAQESTYDAPFAVAGKT